MKADFFQANRARLVRECRDGILLVTAYTQQQRSGDAAFGFEQEANFWWLTGVDAPDWQLLQDISAGKAWLIAPEVDAVHHVFDGSLAPDEAQARSGVDGVLNRQEADEKIAAYAQKGTAIWVLGDDPQAKYYDFSVNPAPVALRRAVRRRFHDVRDARPVLSRLRAIKQPAELVAMQRAIDGTIEAFEHVRSTLGRYAYEYEVEAEFGYYFRRHGFTGHAYDPIVAAGAHACTLHYDTNNGPLKKSELLLMDIGARADGYAADITRTYTVGTPTARQRDVHQAVQSAHQQIIDLIQPGGAVREYHESVDRIMRQAIASLGLQSDEAAYRRYFPHAVSHGLGVDVHDSLGRPEEFVPQMVLTVEPGIYIPEEGIGVRIEDDILVTDDGRRNLSAALSTDLA